MKRGIFLFFVFLGFYTQGFAQDSLLLHPDISLYDLESKWFYSKDDSKNLVWQDMFREYQQGSLPKFTEDLDLSFLQVSSAAHWLILKVHNPSQDERRYVLSTRDPNILEADFFQIDIQQRLVSQQVSGTSLAPSHRSLGGLNPAFVFKVSANESSILLLRLYSTNYLSLKTTLHPVEDYLNSQLKQYFYLGLFYGIVSLILAYHFLFFVYTREWSFIFLLAYHGCFGLITGFFDGFTSTYFHGIYLLTDFRPEVPLVVCIAIFSQLSLRSFLNTSKYLPFYDQIIKAFIVLCVFALGFNVFYPEQIFLLIPLLVVCSFIIILWISHQLKAQHPVRATYFFYSYLFFWGIVFFVLLSFWRIIPVNYFVVKAIYWGYMGQMLILSVGFAVELKKLIQEYVKQVSEREKILKDKNQELEDKVIDRTKNLFINTNQLKSVIESTDDVIYSINRKGELLVINSAAKNRARKIYDSEIEVGQNFFDQLPIALKPIFEPMLEKVWKGEAVKKTEKVHYEGITLIQELSINPIFDEQGEVTGAAIFSKDLTEIVQRTDMLAQTNANLRAILDNNDSAIWLVNRAYILIDMNYTAEKIYDLTNQKKPVIGHSALDFLSPEDQKTWAERYKKVLQTGESQMYIEHHQYDKQTVDFLVKIFPIRANDEITGLSIFLNNITEQHQAEKALQENQKLLLSINQHLSEGIYRSNNNNVVYANQAFADMFGYNLEEVLQNKAITYYLNPTVREELIKVLEVEGAYQNQEVQFKRKDGSTFWSLISSTRYIDENGDTFFDGVIRDISALKKAEEELLAKNETLLKINKELDKFVYSASHDLRAPLTSMLGLIQIIQDEPDEDTRKQYFELMIKSIRRLDHFIRQIVDYSRNTRTELKLEKIDFKVLIQQVFQSVEYLDHTIDIEKKSSIQQTHDFYTDVFRLEVVLNNLVSNAIKYANPYQDKPKLEINVEAAASEAVIQVIDNGQGIEAAYINNIFEMFYKANTQNKGSGLGLYIVRETLDVMNGKIEVSSEFGVGTMFTVKIPNLIPNKDEKKEYRKNMAVPK